MDSDIQFNVKSKVVKVTNKQSKQELKEKSMPTSQQEWAEFLAKNPEILKKAFQMQTYKIQDQDNKKLL